MLVLQRCDYYDQRLSAGGVSFYSDHGGAGACHFEMGLFDLAGNFSVKTAEFYERRNSRKNAAGNLNDGL